MPTFKDLGLNSDIMKSLDELGFVEPSPVQAQAIPFVLESKQDLVALAQTGTGKTAAFSLPILQQIKAGEHDLQAFVICPTRELCLQISQDIRTLGKYSKGLTVTSVYGGERIDLQIKSLKRGTNIVVGTPGRVNDLIRRKVLKLQNIKWLVLDEADEMLDMGFKDDLDTILKEIPDTKQTLLFSATMSRTIRGIASKYMGDAKEISVGEKNKGADNVTHEYYVVQARDRFEALKRILDSIPNVYGILFCRTRRETQEIADKLKRAGYDSEAIHGDVSQNMRTQIMGRFKKKEVHLLVATDVAARGIDVSDLTHVINYNLPDQKEIYTHRSGRTGRAQKSGISVSLVGPRETRKVKDLERMIGKSFMKKDVPSGEQIYQKQIDNFIEEILNTDIEKNSSDEHFIEIVNKLNKITKEDLIKHFVAHKFNDLINEYKNTRDINATHKDFNSQSRGSDENTIDLKINFGKQDQFDVKALFVLVNAAKGLQGLDVGKINLLPDHSIFGVEKTRADEVIKALDGIVFRGQKVHISKSTASRSDGGRKRGRSGDSYAKRRSSGSRGGGYKGKRSSGGYEGRKRSSGENKGYGSKKRSSGGYEGKKRSGGGSGNYSKRRSSGGSSRSSKPRHSR